MPSKPQTTPDDLAKKLLPCPNCKKLANLIISKHWSFATCSFCWVQTGELETPEQAVEEWNERY